MTKLKPEFSTKNQTSLIICIDKYRIQIIIMNMLISQNVDYNKDKACICTITAVDDLAQIEIKTLPSFIKSNALLINYRAK